MNKQESDLTLVILAIPSSSAMIAWAVENWHVVWWGLWIAAFLAVELTAVFNARLGDTSSEAWWRYLRIKTGPVVTQDGKRIQYFKPWPLWIAVPLRLVVVAFGIWLIGHLGFGLWGGE